MAKAELKSFEEILDKKFIVKTYQRGYRWENTEIEELLFDLDAFNEKNDDFYCLQPIVVKPDGEYFELVDGQQRLTALWLILQVRNRYSSSTRISPFILEYEGKNDFTKLLRDIQNKCNSFGTIDDVVDLAQKHMNDSIDAYMLYKSLNTMKEFKIDMFTDINAVVTDIMRKRKQIGVIWYELDSVDNPISFFTNLNANKIALTDAELIKAALLNAIVDENKKRDVANEWETIEKGLYNEDLWYFVAYDINKAVRIEYLFEIWCNKMGYSIEPQEKNEVFHAVNKELGKNTSPLEIWDEIKVIYETLVDWKDDYVLYNEIGLLTLLNDKKDENVKLIKEIYESYSNSKKSEFKDVLVDKIKNCFIGTSKKMLAKDTTLAEIEAGIGSLQYGLDDLMIRKVLLLHSITLLLAADNHQERFPFKLYKLRGCDIEHINPQTPEFNDSEKKKWLEDHKKYSSLSAAIVNDIDSCIKKGLRNFEEVANKIRTELSLDEHCIGNLVLLEKKINRGYQNVCFYDKRKTIIESLRSNTPSDEAILPLLPGTKWVFLKEYVDVKNTTLWTKDDVEAYVKDITDRITEFFK